MSAKKVTNPKQVKSVKAAINRKVKNFSITIPVSQKERPKSSYKRDYIYASEAGQCSRKIAMNMLGYDGIPFTDATKKIFLIGNVHHEIIQRVMQDITDEWFEVEGVEKSAKFAGYSCRVDGIIRDKETGERYVVEIKSVNPMAFNNRKHTAQPEHIAQLHIGMKALEIDKGIILYIDKNNMEISEFFVEYSDSTIKELIEQKDEILTYVEQEKLPDIPFADEKECWECSYCKYKDQCWDKTFIISDGEKLQAEDTPESKKFWEIEEQIKGLKKESDSLKKILKDMVEVYGSGYENSYVSVSLSEKEHKVKLKSKDEIAEVIGGELWDMITEEVPESQTITVRRKKL